MSDFIKYRRTQIAEMRDVTQKDINNFEADKHSHSIRDIEFRVSVSGANLTTGSPKIGDKIARNPINHEDQWLVSEKYFKDNFEPL